MEYINTNNETRKVLKYEEKNKLIALLKAKVKKNKKTKTEDKTIVSIIIIILYIIKLFLKNDL